MARIEKENKIKNFSYKVIDRYKATFYFKTYRAALAYFLTQI